MIIAIVAVLALVAVVGFWAPHLLFGRREPDDPLARGGTAGQRVDHPVRMLATLLLAFVLAAVFQSFQDASDDAASDGCCARDGGRCDAADPRCARRRPRSPDLLCALGGGAGLAGGGRRG